MATDSGGRMSSMKPRGRIALTLCVLGMSLIGCGVLTRLPFSQTSEVSETSEVSATASATATSTPTIAPSPTPMPTSTPSLTPTFAGPTPVALSCRVLSQSIKNNRHFSPKEDFEMGWLVRNNGAAAWDPGSVDFAYFSGTRMYLFSPNHLQAIVNPGETVALGASLVAPKNSGTYTTVWALWQGAYDFCHVSVRIIVP